MKKIIFLFIMSALLAFTASNCKTNNVAEGGNGIESPPANTVYIYDNFFTPETLTVTNPNTVITWVNKGSINHTVTSDTSVRLAGAPVPPVEKFHSGTLVPGARFQYTFQWEGDWDYHCRIHPSMTAKIKVRF